MKGELDILDGSPPCQGFSTAGKRRFNHPRNSLFMEFARLLSELSPKVFVMENVTGMVKGYMKQAYLVFIKTLRECGYLAKGEIMNAMYYNVPQSRERVFIIGVREDFGIGPSHPRPAKKPIKVKDALVDIPPGPPENHRKQVIEAWERSKPGKSLRHSNKYVGSFQSFKLNPQRPPYVLIKNHRHWRWDVPRLLNDLEIKRICFFPDDFILLPAKKEAQQIGNSVPPNLMRAIAEHIRMNILDKINGERSRT